MNNKCYIGQTSDYKRRMREHKACGYGEEKVLYEAFNKYGLDNFTFEIIEETEYYNDRERYWIDHYNSYRHGYNMTLGGEEPPVKYGEAHHLATHSLKDVHRVMDMIQNTNKSFKEIAQLCNYNTSSIDRINKGELWFDSDLNYPLRREITYSFKQERAYNIISDLLETNLTQKDIAKKYNVGRTTITAINNGQNFKQKDLDYPLRKCFRSTLGK